ncbi:hypothetical protein F2P56_020350 [Juglans regia]|uniref:Uncharacterized protein n=2 Tax=Juglans regia TaxID=51240 RepID=A0A833TIH5_JUGRE|nr:uncharacterized protein LOC108993748 [Juglans regia]KAF5460486.1 hypothetical protein F2P56_020350 [Juglans regia]
MGNCLFGGLGEVDHGVVEVVTSNGGVMEFYTPISVGYITQEFPGHGIFRSHDLFWKPLSPHEELVAGQSYYLLPVNDDVDKDDMSRHGQIVRRGHVRSNSSVPASLAASYRMSLDYQGLLKRSYTDVFSKYNNGRFWKVKLVISPEQLVEILSQEGRTQELIENVRTVAKCGKGGVSDLEFSDQWSLSSSWNASTKKEALVDMI